MRSPRGRHWPMRTPQREQTIVDPYGPKSEGIGLRAREFETVELNGTVRVDIGAPIARLRDEPQAKLRKAEPTKPATPAPKPAALPEVAPAPAAKAPRAPDIKPGLGKRA